MAAVLVVDDSLIDPRLAGRLLQSRHRPAGGPEPTGRTVTCAPNGREALDATERDAPAVVVTDLLVPGMTGLEVVGEVRARHPLVPVVLMTAHGSEGMAVRAPQAGAAGDVPKRDLARDLLPSGEAVIEASQARRDHARLMQCLTRTEADFVLDHDPSLVPPLVGRLREGVARTRGADETDLVRVTMAVREARLNATAHGNLEPRSAPRGRSDDEAHRLADERRADPRVRPPARPRHRPGDPGGGRPRDPRRGAGVRRRGGTRPDRPGQPGEVGRPGAAAHAGVHVRGAAHRPGERGHPGPAAGVVSPRAGARPRVAVRCGADTAERVPRSQPPEGRP